MRRPVRDLLAVAAVLLATLLVGLSRPARGRGRP
jgi:hypothetical protein